MTKRIFRSIFLVALAVLFASLGLILGVLYGYFGDVQSSQLKTALTLASAAVETGGIDYLVGLPAGDTRLTWVSSDGSVLYDSQSDASAMENHARREEIRDALDNGEGESVRYSSTLTRQTIYRARRLNDGTVLRVASSRMTMAALILAMLQSICLVLAAALILSGVLAGRLSRSIVKPLSGLNLDQPLQNDVYEELSPILTRLEQSHRQIRHQSQELESRRREFQAVVANMNEGLALLSREGTVLSMNPSASAFFGVGEDCTGKDFLSVDRDPALDNAIRLARETGKSEISQTRGERCYRLRLSRVAGGGVVLLILDVTEKITAENARREFTANVSHELKTPLQSIMGSAELLENGLVKPEDTGKFMAKIREESNRLLALIDDIIRLSQLEEQGHVPTEEVNITALARRELEALESVAEARSVTLALHGEEVTANGAPRLIQEILYNLCDNAIKYNVPGGRVDVTVAREEGSVILTVADTGIGIPPEHLPRIFERFYRVDKSRSRALGGTGLGLAIVKHAAEALGGNVTIQSTPGKGTAVTVRLGNGQQLADRDS